jgi:hypothetical protein
MERKRASFALKDLCALNPSLSVVTVVPWAESSGVRAKLPIGALRSHAGGRVAGPIAIDPDDPLEQSAVPPPNAPFSKQPHRPLTGASSVSIVPVDNLL